MRYEHIEKILEDEKNPHLQYSFESGYMYVQDMIDYELEWEGARDDSQMLAEVILPLIGQMVGALDYLEHFAKHISANPKMTFAQMDVVLSFEDDMASGLNMAWGVEADKILPPKGTGWENYVAAKKAVGL